MLLAAIFFTLTLLIGLNRYFSFFASYDQGIFNQVFWNGLHGRFFQSTLSSVLSSAVTQDNQVPDVLYRRLGQHFTPALLLWLPIYALRPAAETLVFLQVGLITAGGLMLYALARHSLQPAIAWLITAGYYGANAVIGPTFSNFHDLTQIPLFVFTLLLAMEKRLWWLFWLMAGLILLVRQDQGVSLFGIGVYLIVSRRFPKIGLALCTLAFGYVVLATNVLMPMISPDISRRFMIERFGQYAQGGEASSLQILWAILSNPARLSANIFRDPHIKVFYLLIQTLPLAFVPFKALFAWTIAGFPLFQLFVQKGESPLSLHIRYAMTIVPGLFYGTILWWASHGEATMQRLGDRFAQFQRFWKGCIIVSVLIAICYSPHDSLFFIFPTSYRPWVYVSLPRQWEHVSQIRSLIDQIPRDASVTATTYVVPHLSSRRAVLRAPFVQFRNDQRQVEDVEYVLLDLWQLERYSVVFRGERGNLRRFVPLVDELQSQQKYGIVALNDRVILLQKGITSKPGLPEAWAELRQEYDRLLQKYPQK